MRRDPPLQAAPLLAVLFLVAVFPAVPAEQGAFDGCDPSEVPYLGPACRLANGLWAVFSSDGRYLGTTHGPDPAPHAEPAPTVASTTPYRGCVDPAEDPNHALVIYARAHDMPDQYAARLAGLRNAVHGANQYLMDAAAATGTVASIKVACLGGEIRVDHAVLGTRRSSTTFSSVVSDLQALGYLDPKIKHWVYFDASIGGGIAGTGHIEDDDRLVLDNRNNAPPNGWPMYAVSFGYLWGDILLHELGHNLGAVQKSAPRSTGAWHCTDGLDIMCYNDGGPKGNQYTTSRCPVDVFDCGKDDYFHANPPPGNYLATHWNLGSRLNRFLAFNVPMMSCGTPVFVDLGSTTTCTFSTTGSAEVHYDLSWGDGTTERVPAVGTLPPGDVQTTTHTYAGTGAFVVTLVATDTAGVASAPVRQGVEVVDDVGPPTVQVLAPVPNRVYAGCAHDVVVPSLRPLYVGLGCVSVIAKDDDRVARVAVLHAGKVVAERTSPNGVGDRWILEFPSRPSGLAKEFIIQVSDRRGNLVEATRIVDVVG